MDPNDETLRMASMITLFNQLPTGILKDVPWNEVELRFLHNDDSVEFLVVRVTNDKEVIKKHLREKRRARNT